MGSPCVVRRTVEPRADYLDYREDLRVDFWFSCAYCTLTEAEARAVGFEIDHYNPAAELRRIYENLLWSCRHCNRNKTDYYPTPETSPAEFILRPDQHDPRDHMAVVGDSLQPITQTGDFNIEWLRLNRETLKRLRRLREKFWNDREYISRGVFGILAVGIDSVPRTVRLQLLQIQQQLKADAEMLEMTLGEFVSTVARSPMLDADAIDRTRPRRKFLAGEKALAPGSISTSPIREARTRVRNRRKRRKPRKRRK